MGVVEIVVIAILAMTSIAVVTGFLVMVVGSERRHPARRTKANIAPGWYPDAQDESLLRYFDGRVPTRKTSRRELT